MDILVVDDRSRTRQSLRVLLKTLPDVSQIREAKNGEQAVKLVSELLPDLIVIDAKMPEMDGVQATRLIKQRWPQVKVILLSMYPEYQESGRQAGADAFVSKGQPPEVLLATISEVMEQGE